MHPLYYKKYILRRNPRKRRPVRKHLTRRQRERREILKKSAELAALTLAGIGTYRILRSDFVRKMSRQARRNIPIFASRKLIIAPIKLQKGLEVFIDHSGRIVIKDASKGLRNLTQFIRHKGLNKLRDVLIEQIEKADINPKIYGMMYRFSKLMKTKVFRRPWTVADENRWKKSFLKNKFGVEAVKDYLKNQPIYVVSNLGEPPQRISSSIIALESEMLGGGAKAVGRLSKESKVKYIEQNVLRRMENVVRRAFKSGFMTRADQDLFKEVFSTQEGRRMVKKYFESHSIEEGERFIRSAPIELQDDLTTLWTAAKWREAGL